LSSLSIDDDSKGNKDNIVSKVTPSSPPLSHSSKTKIKPKDEDSFDDDKKSSRSKSYDTALMLNSSSFDASTSYLSSKRSSCQVDVKSSEIFTETDINHNDVNIKKKATLSDTLNGGDTTINEDDSFQKDNNTRRHKRHKTRNTTKYKSIKTKSSINDNQEHETERYDNNRNKNIKAGRSPLDTTTIIDDNKKTNCFYKPYLKNLCLVMSCKGQDEVYSAMTASTTKKFDYQNDDKFLSEIKDAAVKTPLKTVVDNTVDKCCKKLKNLSGIIKNETANGVDEDEDEFVPVVMERLMPIMKIADDYYRDYEEEEDINEMRRRFEFHLIREEEKKLRAEQLKATKKRDKDNKDNNNNSPSTVFVLLKFIDFNRFLIVVSSILFFAMRIIRNVA
jgi:ATP-dependent 26S proteasome regulatory subunit